MRGVSEDKLQRRYPVLHKEDTTVSYWSFRRQEWMKHTIFVPVEDLADMHPYDRRRIARHLGNGDEVHEAD
jgi:hypothetical protein